MGTPAGNNPGHLIGYQCPKKVIFEEWVAIYFFIGK